MAEEAAAGGAKDAIELLAKLKELLGGADAVEAAAAVAAPWSEVTGAFSAEGVSNSSAGAAVAAARFRATMRWLVGVIGAIGIVVFGSTAFTDEIDIGHWRVWVGLGLAAGGLVSVCYAATRVQEPEDASLGELLFDIDWLRDHYPPVNGRYRSVQQYVDILDKERLADPRDFVKKLIDDLITDVDRRRCPATHLAIARAETLEYQNALASVAARRQALLDGLHAATSNKELPEVDKIQARRSALPLIAGASTRLSDLEAEVASRHEQIASKVATLTAIDVPLRARLLERELIVNEYAVSQIRGTFREARRWLLTGAVLTLAGTILYLGAAKDGNDDTADAGSDAKVTHLLTGTLVFSANDAAFVDVKTRCRGVELDVLFDSLELPAANDAYTVTVVSPPECVGTYPVAKDTTGDTLTIDVP